MTATGEFIDRPARSLPPIPARIMVVALAIAILGGALAIALLAVWLVLTLIPFVIGAGLIAYGAYRLQLWSGRASLGGKRDLFRP